MVGSDGLHGTRRRHGRPRRRRVAGFDGHTGFTIYNTWTYSRVTPNERLEFINRFVDADRQGQGSPGPRHPAQHTREVPHVVTFRPLPDGRTENRSLDQSGYETADAAAGFERGLAQTFDKLAALFGG